jgi:hypothetical protein
MKKGVSLPSDAQRKKQMELYKEFKSKLEKLSYEEIEELKLLISCKMAQQDMKIVSNAVRKVGKQIKKEMEEYSQEFFDSLYHSTFDVQKKK